MSTEEPNQAAKRPNWWPWVHEQMLSKWGKPNIARLARESGLDRSNLYTWQSGGDVEPAKVGAVAAALGANPIEAYIAAGYFTEAQFDEYRAAGLERVLSNDTLAREVLARMNRAAGPGRAGGPDVSDALPANRRVEITHTAPEGTGAIAGGPVSRTPRAC